jgi:hypothetical protein
MRTRILGVGCTALLALAVMAASASAQTAETRYGQWKMRSDAPPPSSNIMTYAPFGNGGMSITVASVNREGRENEWGYDTMFDGEFRPVHGQDGARTTAVEFINDRSTRITNMAGGRVTQVIINTLSEDGNSISNEYVRLDEDGNIVSVGHAIYEKIR